MKHRLLPAAATAAILTAVWSVPGSACDKTKSAEASVSKSAAAGWCGSHGAAGGAKTADATGKAAGACAHKSASAKTAEAGHAGCASKSGKNAAAHAARGVDAVPAGGSSCQGRGATTTGEAYSHIGCDACADMAICDAELKAAGTVTQFVKLKNGVMFVYTAETPNQVNAVQTAMNRRSERLSAISNGGYKAKLCPECKTMRGAIASGKLTREMVTIEGGCLTLMTSSDPAVVSKLHKMLGEQTAARVKS